MLLAGLKKANRVMNKMSAPNAFEINLTYGEISGQKIIKASSDLKCFYMKCWEKVDEGVILVK